MPHVVVRSAFVGRIRFGRILAAFVCLAIASSARAEDAPNSDATPQAQGEPKTKDQAKPQDQAKPVEAAPKVETAACTEVTGQIAAARKAGDLAELEKLFALAEKSETSCTAEKVVCLSRSAAMAFHEAVVKKPGSGAAEVAALVARGRKIGSPWQLLALDGDLRMSRAKTAPIAQRGPIFADASFAYQLALIDAGEAISNCGDDERPSADAVKALYHQMTSALLLADHPLVASSRCGVCEWLFLNGVGGYVPDSRPLPITFAKDSAEPTPLGREAIEALMQCAKAAHWTSMTLSGHTDQQGNDDLNVKLSGKRLETIKKMLADKGLAAEIILDAKGKAEPYKVAENEGFSLLEKAQLNRRIELRATQPVSAATCGP